MHYDESETSHPFNPKMSQTYPIMFNFTLYECAEIVHIKNVDVPAGDDVYHASFKCSEDFWLAGVFIENIH